MAEATTQIRRHHTWLIFLARRIGRLIVSLAVVLSLSFLLIQFIPGDPVRLALGPTAPASMVAQQRAALGLTKPLIVQYLDYWHDVLTGHLGASIVSGQPVEQIIATDLPVTAELVGVALVFTMILSVSIGMFAGALTARGRRPRLTLFFTSVTSILNTIPEYLLGVGLVFVFAVTLKLLPVAGDAGLAVPGPAGAGHRHRTDRRAGPDRPGPDRRGPRPGVHARGPGQTAADPAHLPAACPAEPAHRRAHHRRAAARHAGGQQRGGRERLRPAWPGHRDRPGDHAARLSGHPGDPARPRRRGAGA